MLFIIANILGMLVSCAPIEDAKGTHVKLNEGALVPPIIDAFIPTAKGEVDEVIPTAKGAQVDAFIPTAKGNQVDAQFGIVVDPLGKGNIQGPPAGQCKALGINRQDCGFPGITLNQCAVKGCCYSEVENEGPYCFYTDGTPNVNLNPIQESFCTFSDLFRVSCGDTFTELECRNRGCCFSETAVIKCSYGFSSGANSAILSTQVVNNQIQQGIVIGDGQVQIQGNQGVCTDVVAPLARVDCGFDGITENECIEKNCCFGLLPVGQEGPICYQKAGAAKASGYKKA